MARCRQCSCSLAWYAYPRLCAACRIQARHLQNRDNAYVRYRQDYRDAAPFSASVAAPQPCEDASLLDVMAAAYAVGSAADSFTSPSAIPECSDTTSSCDTSTDFGGDGGSFGGGGASGDW